MSGAGGQRDGRNRQQGVGVNVGHVHGQVDVVGNKVVRGVNEPGEQSVAASSDCGQVGDSFSVALCPGVV